MTYLICIIKPKYLTQIFCTVESENHKVRGNLRLALEVDNLEKAAESDGLYSDAIDSIVDLILSQDLRTYSNHIL